jgi:hypothetical protein
MNKMRCLSCDKEISSIAKVCPYCHRDTKASAEAHSVMVVGVFLGAAIGYFVSDSAFTGALYGMLWGGLAILPFYVYLVIKAGNEPAKVQVVDDGQKPITSSSLGSSEIKSRLDEVERLRKEGVLSEAEASQKRKELIDLL